MSRPPALQLVPLGDDCYALNLPTRTVAVVTSQGYVDWLLRAPRHPGALLGRLYKETHLSYVLGLKFQLTLPTPATELRRLEWTQPPDRATITLIAHGSSHDDRFASRTEATLAYDPGHREYAWQVTTTLTCTAAEPVTLPRFIEYNNVYPGKAGRCFLFAPEKQYHSTLLEDADGTVWEFPHQHLLHHSRKIDQLRFAEQGMGGFFGEQSGSPVVLTQRSNWPLHWAICDMYYDLHCMACPPGPMAPGETFTCAYAIRYLAPAESRAYSERARPLEYTADDYQRAHYPRLELGLNHFDAPVAIDRFDDASGFRPSPPARVWEPATGRQRRGALRLHNDTPGENVWTAEPPTQIPPQTQLRLAALARTRDVTGEGFFLRVRYHTYHWRPQPHIEWAQTLTTTPLTGTHDEWTRIELPLLTVPADHLDYLIAIDIVLAGQGTAWLTDVDVDLVRVRSQVPTSA